MAANDSKNKTQPTHWLLHRASLLAYLVIVLVVLVAINVLADQHDHSWDLTKNHVNSLSSASVKILHGLSQPLDLIYFDRSSDFGVARSLLGRYQRQSNEVHVRYVDPDRNPAEARRYKITNYGTTVVQSSGRQATVTNLSEQDLTNAIVRVLKGNKKVVYFTTGEGEHDPSDTGREGYSSLKTALEAENFTVQKLNMAQTPTIPKDCAVLVVAGPTHPMQPQAVQAIQTYLDHGGRALFLVGVGEKGPLVDYIQNSLNVQLANDIVVDASGIGRLFGASALMPIGVKYDPQPITDQMHSTATLFPYTRTVAPGSDSKTGAIVSPLVETSPESMAATSFANGQVQVDPSTDKHGPLTMGVAGTLPNNSAAADAASDPQTIIPGARYAVYGTPEFAANAYLGFDGNQDLFLNTMDWLSSESKFINIHPHHATSAPVNMTATQMKWLLVIFLIGLPILVVILGTAVWWRRRAL